MMLMAVGIWDKELTLIESPIMQGGTVAALPEWERPTVWSSGTPYGRERKRQQRRCEGRVCYTLSCTTRSLLGPSI